MCPPRQGQNRAIELVWPAAIGRIKVSVDLIVKACRCHASSKRVSRGGFMSHRVHPDIQRADRVLSALATFETASPVANVETVLSRRRMLALLSVAFAAGGLVRSASAARPQRNSNEQGVSTRDARDDAVRQLPLTKLSREDRNRVAEVVNDASIFRRMPTQVIPCDGQLFRFLLLNPDLVVSLWRTLGISEVSLERTGPHSFRTDDKQGTRGAIDILYSSDDTMLALADGNYDGALFTRKVVGKCVLLFKSGYFQDPDRLPYVSTRLDAFIQVENIGAELLVKSFQPLVGHFADHNFRETAHFVATLNRAAQVNPGKVEQLAGKLNDVSPVTRQQFVTITQQLAARVAERDETADIEPPQLARKPAGTAPIRR